MKKFLKYTLLFLLPVMIVTVIMFSLPTDHKRAYHYLTNDCEGRATWIYTRIYESNEPIDIAFLGSSHTINGINDSIINSELKKNSLKGTTVCNLGYCRLGRDLTYVFMKALIKEKQTKTFIIEVLPDENELGHPVFAFLADSRELINPKVPVNRTYIPNLYNGAVAKLMYIRQNIFDEAYVSNYHLPGNNGFTTNAFKADTNELNTKKERREKKKFKGSNFSRDLMQKFPQAWLRSIYTLSEKNNARIIFLYIPPYGSPEKKPIQIATYTQYGSVWIAPDSIFANKSNWYDHEHLNINGATGLSKWVAEKIAEEKLD